MAKLCLMIVKNFLLFENLNLDLTLTFFFFLAFREVAYSKMTLKSDGLGLNFSSIIY